MSESKSVEKGFFEGLFEALSDKHSQFDVNFQGVTIRFPRIGTSIELNGIVTLTVHWREMTEEEKNASVAKNVALLSGGTMGSDDDTSRD